jgi:hypothetical protein
MTSKYFIWLVHVPMCLWKFSWNFWNFLSIFRALKTFSGLYWNCFRTKNIFGNNNISFSIGPSPWAQPTSTSPASSTRTLRPSHESIWPPALACTARHGSAAADPLLGVCAPGNLRAPRLFKVRSSLHVP